MKKEWTEQVSDTIFWKSVVPYSMLSTFESHFWNHGPTLDMGFILT